MTARPTHARMAVAVLGLCVLLNIFSRGVGEAYAVFLLPLAEEFGWERAEVSSVYAVYMLVTGVSAPVAGWLFDRIGPRRLFLVGMAGLGGGAYLASHLTALWQFYLCLGVLAGFGAAAIGMAPTSGLISRWFRDRLSTAMGIGYAGLATGTLLLAPVAQLLIDRYGWRGAYAAIGGTILLLLPLVQLLPLGRVAAGHPVYAEERWARVAAGGDWTLARALGTGAFWALFAVFFFTAVSIYAVTLQSVAYLVEAGLTPLEAATAFGLNGILSVVGMAATGWLADRLGPRRTVTITYSLTLVGIGFLFLVGQWAAWPLVALYVLTFGVAQGSRGPVVFTLVARLFAGGGLGAIYGAVTMGMGTGAAAGSWLAGWLHDVTGGYGAGLTLGAVAAAVGLAQFWLVRSLRTGRPE